MALTISRFTIGVAAFALMSHAHGEALSDLKGLSLEQLTQVEVTSVSRRSEKLLDAAAAVEVIPGDRILRAGANTLQDALRLATGMQVSQLNGREWTISSRGFATIASNKMEVNQDGRSLYGPLFSGVLWDVQSVVLEDLDRIEVIRGPGAALWGANAVNGVISIVTKPAAETQGAFVQSLLGTTDRRFAVRYGGTAGPRGFYRVFADALETRGLQFANGANAGDDRRLLRVGGRWDARPVDGTNFTLQGSAYRGLIDQFGPVQGSVHTVQGGYVNGRIDRRISEHVNVHVLGYYDHAERQIPRTYSEIRNTVNLEVETELHSARHAAILGARGRISADRIGNGPSLGFHPSHRTIRLFSLYGQDRYTLPDERWRVTVGSTLEHNTFTGMEFQPTVRLSFAAAPHWMVWVGGSKAVRTPSRIETDVIAPGPAGLTLLAGSPTFRAEEMKSLEVGWRWHHKQGVAIDVSAFENRYEHLRSLEPGGGTVIFLNRNLLSAASNGIEVSSTLRPAAWARLIVSARYMDKAMRRDPASRSPNNGSSEGNDAREIVTAHLSLDLPRDFQFDAVVRHVGKLPEPLVPAYTAADLRLAWRPNRRWEIAVSGRNLFSPAHVEATPGGSAAEQVRRAGALSVTWQR